MNRNEKIKRRNLILLSIVLFLVLIIILVYIFVFRKTNNIIIKEEFETIEYGTDFEYKDMIEEVRIEKAKLEFPDFKPTQVGKYEIPVIIKDGENKKEEIIKFEIIDTKTPKMKLFIKKNDVKVMINKEYDITRNIEVIENMDTLVLNDKIKLEEKEYNGLKKKIENEKEKLDERVISKKKDIKNSDITKNAMFYTTKLDTTKKGVYEVKVSLVDENYNLTEESWNIEVVEKGIILNSGGSISCDYEGDDIEDESAYKTTVVENYLYNPHKIVSSYEIVTTMIFNEDYDTDENKNALIRAFNEKYAPYQDKKGVVLTVEKVTNSVVAKISINMQDYDKKKDVLDVLKTKDGSEVKITTVLETAKENKYICK